MKAWIIFDTANSEAIYIRETSQEVCEAAEQMTKLAILDSDERTPSDAERLIVVPEFDGDTLSVAVFIAGERDFPYMYVKARKFDSTDLIKDW
jgi:hypothetical protein